MDNILDPNSPNPTDQQNRNVIPDTLRKIIDPADDPITGANYVTVTFTPPLDGELLPVRHVWAPGHEAVDPAMDLNKIADNFDDLIKSELSAHIFQMDPDVVWMDNSTKSLDNSTQSAVTRNFFFEELNNNLITYQVNAFQEADVISDPDQLSSLSSRIESAMDGYSRNLFVNADDEDNCIEIRPEDAAQTGGIRAWGGNDKILGSENNDVAYGMAGDDKMFGAGGDDLLLGGEGDDSMCGGAGDDMLMGNSGNDYLAGGAGNDVLVGGDGSNVLIGNEGNDILIGNCKGDFLMGSAGADEFILTANSVADPMLMNNATSATRILDFNPAEGDRIKIAGYQGVEGWEDIRFAYVDVNLDLTPDVAILAPDRIVGVIIGDQTNPSQFNDLTSSISMVSPLDTTRSQINTFSMLG